MVTVINTELLIAVMLGEGFVLSNEKSDGKFKSKYVDLLN